MAATATAAPRVEEEEEQKFPLLPLPPFPCFLLFRIRICPSSCHLPPWPPPPMASPSGEAQDAPNDPVLYQPSAPCVIASFSLPRIWAEFYLERRDKERLLVRLRFFLSNDELLCGGYYSPMNWNDCLTFDRKSVPKHIPRTFNNILSLHPLKNNKTTYFNV